MVDMTNARAAVYALEEPLVKACPELTIDRVIADYTVSDATKAHERAVMAEYTWPALPAHLRSLPDARAMVRHWVRTDYQWAPTP